MSTGTEHLTDEFVQYVADMQAQHDTEGAELLDAVETFLWL